MKGLEFEVIPEKDRISSSGEHISVLPPPSDVKAYMNKLLHEQG